MAFKIPNFSKQMGGSPFKNVDYSAYKLPNYADKKAGWAHRNALSDYRMNLMKNDPEAFARLAIGQDEGYNALRASKDDVIKKALIEKGFYDDPKNQRYLVQQPSTVVDPADEIGSAGPAEPQATNWDPALNELVTQRSGLEPGSNEYNIVQNKINEISGVSKRYPVVDTVEDVVINPDNVEALDVAVDVNQHVPSEGINIISGKNNRKQRRAARRVARLRKKAQNQEGLTEGQSKKLNRNISKAKGEDVAFADRSRLGQIANITGDALGLGKDEVV